LTCDRAVLISMAPSCSRTGCVWGLTFCKKNSARVNINWCDDLAFLYQKKIKNLWENFVNVKVDAMVIKLFFLQVMQNKYSWRNRGRAGQGRAF
jgi:hypothetical protein